MSQAALGQRNGAAAETKKHIVDVLIEERAERLMQSPVWPLLRAGLYPLLRRAEAVRMADAIAPLSGEAAIAHLSALLALDVLVRGLEHVPEKGRIIVASTHPTGIADGIAMHDALKRRREDLAFFANRDAIRVSPGLADLLIPVEWVEEKRTMGRSRETLTEAKKAFEAEKCVVLFPAGRLAFMDENKVLTERDWMNSVAIFARKFECDVAPAHIEARNSWLYYWFWKLSTELRDITLFNELLNKKKKRFLLAFGERIAHQDLSGDPAAATRALRDHAAYGIPAGRAWTGAGRSR